MSKDKKISIAMATYNGERFLREQLDSLYSQTHVPDEIVVVDDRSTDGTAAILEEYHQKKGLRYYINEKNLGVNRNFEKAIRLCTGDYVAISDQDDVWLPYKVETSLKKLVEIEHGKPACVSSQCIGVDKDLNKLPSYPRINDDTYGYKATILQDGVSQGCSLMFNRALIDTLKEFPEKWFMYDAYIAIVAASTGVKYNIAKPLMYYRHHDLNVVGRERKPAPLLGRIVNHLRIWKFSSIFENKRFRFINYIYNTYSNEISPESKELMEILLKYEHSSLLFKLKYLRSENYFSFMQKVSIMGKLLVTSILPLSVDKLKQ